jgi:hypothetical protein
MRELVTTLLDTLGLLLVAAGAGVGAGRVIGWSGLAVSGLVVLAGSALAARVVRPSGGRR